jgi:hypothetical protein|tara:strand:- start:219 stop:1190 length:972 start_codon:yes stop_codon:yes gene_type:complete
VVSRWVQHASRDFSYYYDEDGMLVFKGSLPPEEGAVLIKAVEAIIESTSAIADKTSIEKNVPAGTLLEDRSESEKTHTQCRADALVHLSEHFLATSTSGNGARALAGGEKYQVLLHINTDQIETAKVSTHNHSHIDNGPMLSPATIRRLCCDASLVASLEDSKGNVLNIGRKSRLVLPSIRRALRHRDQGCRYPGCCETRYVDAHHIQHWCDGGETSLDNLVLLCRQHHRLLHGGGCRIEKSRDRSIGQLVDQGNITFIDSSDREIHTAIYPQFDNPDLLAEESLAIELEHEGMGLTIDSRTAVTRWQGEVLDYGMAVSALLR